MWPCTRAWALSSYIETPLCVECGPLKSRLSTAKLCAVLALDMCGIEQLHCRHTFQAAKVLGDGGAYHTVNCTDDEVKDETVWAPSQVPGVDFRDRAGHLRWFANVRAKAGGVGRAEGAGQGPVVSAGEDKGKTSVRPLENSIEYQNIL